MIQYFFFPVIPPEKRKKNMREGPLFSHKKHKKQKQKKRTWIGIHDTEIYLFSYYLSKMIKR